MDLSRTGSILALILWLVQCLLWWAGGGLLVTHTFRLRARERLLTGLALGLLLFIVFADLLANLLPVAAALWGGALAVLAAGLLAAWRSPRRPLVSREDLRGWPHMLAFAALLALFIQINRGLALFDDYHNLPLVSLMAAGDVPPHFYLDPSQRLAYHYGLHIFAAGLVRLGGFYPWAAFDAAKAVSMALALGLAWLWLARVVRPALARLAGVSLVLLGGGARWLLLLLPAKLVIRAGAGLQPLGTTAAMGADLSTMLGRFWNTQGGGPIPFPFAFINGIFPPLNFALGGGGALPQMTVVLLLLLARRRWRPSTGLVYGLALASLALTGEHLFALLWAGFLAASLLGRRPPVRFAGWGWVLWPSLAFALLGGGVITEVARSLVARLVGTASSSFGFAGFSLRWPPALLSGHLGPLSLFSPGQILIALAEVGPVVLLAPWVTRHAWRRLRWGNPVYFGMAAAALAGFIAPIFIRYGVERDIARLAGSALFIWMLLAIPLAWLALRRGRRAAQPLAGVGFAVTMLAGTVLFAIQLVALPYPQSSYFVTSADVTMSRQYWDRLEPGARVLDSIPYRAVTLFGRSAGAAHFDIYTPRPEFIQLLARPDPAAVARSGYDYIYLDGKWLEALSDEQRRALQGPCVRQLAQEGVRSERSFRRIIDVSGCR